MIVIGRSLEDRDLVGCLGHIYVERRSQKGIVIGGGSMLKDLGKLARQDIEALLGSQVNLQLWVKVKDDWRERPEPSVIWLYSRFLKPNPRNGSPCCMKRMGSGPTDKRREGREGAPSLRKQRGCPLIEGCGV